LLRRNERLPWTGPCALWIFVGSRASLLATASASRPRLRSRASRNRRLTSSSGSSGARSADVMNRPPALGDRISLARTAQPANRLSGDVRAAVGGETLSLAGADPKGKVAHVLDWGCAQVPAAAGTVEAAERGTPLRCQFQTGASPGSAART